MRHPDNKCGAARRRLPPIAGSREVLWLLLVLATAIGPVPAQEQGIQDVLTRASRGQRDAFADDYLADQFDRWHKRFPGLSLTPDSLISGPTYDEIWLRHPDPSPHGTGRIALRIERRPRARIFAIRRLLLPRQSGFRSDERAVLAFAERFAWQFEVGSDGFLLDLLFPDHIRIAYAGRDDKQGAVSLLRQHHRLTLPVHAIGWEQSGARFELRLTLDSALKPLLLSLDIQKYLTAAYFADLDKVARARSLADSMAAWIQRPEPAPVARSVAITAPSAGQALSIFLDRHLSEYNIVRHGAPETAMRFEAGLPDLDGVPPAALHYDVRIDAMSSGSFRVTPSWRTQAVAPLLPADVRESSDFPDPGRLRDTALVSAFNETLQRFGTLGLHASLQGPAPEKRPFAAQLILRGASPDSVAINSPTAYADVLGKLTKARTCYFFPRRISTDRTGMTVFGFAIWQSETRLWHHMVRIEERYRLRPDGQELRAAAVVLFPYIRTENVDALFATETHPAARRAPIPVRK